MIYDARVVARQRGLIVIGTVGILEQAAWNDLVDLEEGLRRLKRTNFRCDERIYEEVLKRNRKGN